jgi:hypothetical protein
MYTLISNLGLRRGVITEGPSLLLSMLISEIFYKFHSFSLECLAFLATWFLISCMVSLARGVFAGETK